MAIQSNANKELLGKTIHAIVVNEQKLLLYINGELVLDYDGTSSMGDEWHAFDYKDNCYDIHIYFDDIHSFDNMEEWLTSCTVEIYGLHDCPHSGHLTINTDDSIVIPITFAFDPMTIFKESEMYLKKVEESATTITKVCSECEEEVPESCGRAYKYEPSRWVCDNCHDELMEDE